MGRGLLCPQCHNHGAWIEYGQGKTPTGIRRYRQKVHGCGYQGKRRYWGRPIANMKKATRTPLVDARTRK